jgi:hypothetical protein
VFGLFEWGFDMPQQVPDEPGLDERFTSDVRIFHLVLVCLALFLLMLSIGLEGSHDKLFIWSKHVYASLARELGFALLIAAAISLTIEVAAKREYRRDVRRYTQEIKRDVFGAVFGVRQPREIVDEVMALMLEPTFIPRDHSLRLTFERLEPGSDTIMPYIVIRVRRAYTAENTTNREQRLPVIFKIAEPPFKGRPADTLDSVYVDGNLLTAKFTSEENRGDRESTVHQSNFEKKIPVAGYGKASVVIHSTLYRDWDDNELSTSPMPSEGLTFSLKLRPEIKKFGVVGIHPRNIELVSKSEPTHEYEYCMPGPVLPYQGIYTWWRCTIAPTEEAQEGQRAPEPNVQAKA